MNRFLKIAACIAFALMLASSSHAQILTPQGRLTLTSNTPVMTSDVVGATTLYYTPYVGNSLPVSTGTALSNQTFSQLNVSMSWATPGDLYDVFAIQVSGAFQLCLFSGWNGTTSRSSSFGLTMLQGIWVNTNTLTNVCETATNLYTVPAKTGIYLGTIYSSEYPGGVTVGMTAQFAPAAAAGGSNNLIGLWNAYNRVPVSSMCIDSNFNWTYSLNAWRAMDGSAGNSVTFVDGLRQSFAKGTVSTMAYNTTAGNNSAIGIVENSATVPTIIASQLQASPGNNVAGAATISAVASFPPVLGLNSIQAWEISYNGVAVTFGLDGIANTLFEGEF